MKIYFIRHGETTLNASRILQSADAELSEKGRQQAEFLAKRVSQLPIEVIISSPMERARQTADIIHALAHKPIIYSNLLAERARPDEITGKSQDDKEVRRITELGNMHITDPDWHYSTEENFFDLRARAQKLLEFLSSRKEENILCITHGVFLKMIILTMGFGEKLTPELWLSIYDFFRTKNTGITLCEKDKAGSWRLHSWNDHAHLG